MTETMDSKAARLLQAVRDDNEKTVRELLTDKEFLEHLKSYEDSMELAELSCNSDEAINELLLDQGYKVYSDYKGWIGLMEYETLPMAVEQAVLLNNVKILKILVAIGANVHQVDDSYNETLVMQAVHCGHVDMVSYLLSTGIQVNHQSKSGGTALHVAVENQELECLQMLVGQENVDLNIKDERGHSPLTCAARLRDWRAMEILINAGCKTRSLHRIKGMNILHMCVANDRAFRKGKKVAPADMMKCIDVLLNAGIDIDTGDNFGKTPLVYALQSNNIVAVKYLLKKNCRTECQDCRERYFYFKQKAKGVPIIGTNMALLPLYTAIFKLDLRAVKLLFAAGTQYHKLQKEPLILTFTEQYEELNQFLITELATPSSMKSLCRRVIRENIRRGISARVKGTGLPPLLQDYICLQDIDEL